MILSCGKVGGVASPLGEINGLPRNGLHNLFDLRFLHSCQIGEGADSLLTKPSGEDRPNPGDLGEVISQRGCLRLLKRSNLRLGLKDEVGESSVFVA